MIILAFLAFEIFFASNRGCVEYTIIKTMRQINQLRIFLTEFIPRIKTDRQYQHDVEVAGLGVFFVLMFIVGPILDQGVSGEHQVGFLIFGVLPFMT